MGDNTKSVVKLSKLTKFYGKFRGVENINLSVAKGSVFGFLGPNGAGKTTTISMMVGLLAPTGGSIKLFGQDNIINATENKARIGYLAGDMSLDKSLTGWQELEYFGSLRGVFDKVYVQELAERLQCNLSRKIKTLSRGNRQKVGLISALMHKPELLILDEPASGLDPLIQAEFNEIIKEHKKRGGTAFVSSHVLSEVQQICDEVGFIKEGKLVSVQPLKTILRAAPKQVRIVTKGKVITDFTTLSGASQVERIGNVITFNYNGNIGQLVKFISAQAAEDITIADADLETIFMNLYEAGNV